ncbi:hypothetical protein D3C87_1571400 [compost metagenome]
MIPGGQVLLPRPLAHQHDVLFAEIHVVDARVPDPEAPLEVPEGFRVASIFVKKRQRHRTIGLVDIPDIDASDVDARASRRISLLGFKAGHPVAEG